MRTEPGGLGPGDLLGPLRVGPVAHGGHWVARASGLVLFVRHALEGELVRVRVTEVARRFARADVVEVLEPSPHRVDPPCPVAGACGGCDFQHVEPAHQRELKRRVVAEQFERLAGLPFTATVEAVEPAVLAWRRRVRYHGSGQDWGLRAHRSHDVVVPPEGCLVAVPALRRPGESGVAPERGGQLVGAQSLDGVWWGSPGEAPVVREVAAGRTWSVRGDGFWQVHPAAADVLVDAVLEGLDPRPGDSAFDLYCGVGLFAGALADRGVRVTGVEGNRAAVELARANVPEGDFRAGAVARVLTDLPGAVDLVVLDPPREGAGREVMAAICSRGPRRIAYVACDPAALARDVATAARLGWLLRGVRAFDLFGMTHHVEAVAVLAAPGGRMRAT